MSHEIDMTTGKAAVFVTGQPAWHRLGTVVETAQTSAEAIKLAGLDWTVEQWAAGAVDPATGAFIEGAGKMANVRTDTRSILGYLSPGYQIFQNAAAFDFMDNIVQGKEAMFHTAGSLFGGRRVWMLARLPKMIRVAKDDAVEPYVLLTNNHDGCAALRMIATTVRVVCNNTLNLALGKAKPWEGLTIQHRGNLDERVKEAREKLGVVVARVDRFEEQAQAMARKSLTHDELRDYFTALVEERSQKSQEKMLGKFLENLENERNSLDGIRGSAWAAYSAVSEWADWQSTVRGQGLAKDNGRLNSIWFGSAAELKQRAFDAALSLAG